VALAFSSGVTRERTRNVGVPLPPQPAAAADHEDHDDDDDDDDEVWQLVRTLNLCSEWRTRVESADGQIRVKQNSKVSSNVLTTVSDMPHCGTGTLSVAKQLRDLGNPINGGPKFLYRVKHGT